VQVVSGSVCDCLAKAVLEDNDCEDIAVAFHFLTMPVTVEKVPRCCMDNVLNSLFWKCMIPENKTHMHWQHMCMWTLHTNKKNIYSSYITLC